ncbi:hypothetical protein HYW35_01340 [Candidatus Saccharibacteria bacterium]|nr:hypothetical protein [Candidatus Saccharibacteria bacterium]
MTVLLPALGTILGGLVWLFVYSLVTKPSIGFDGPAGLFLFLSLTGGWLLFSLSALYIHMRRNGRKNIRVALENIFISGFIVGSIALILISDFAQSHYPDYYPGRGGD